MLAEVEVQYLLKQIIESIAIADRRSFSLLRGMLSYHSFINYSGSARVIISSLIKNSTVSSSQSSTLLSSSSVSTPGMEKTLTLNASNKAAMERFDALGRNSP